MTQLLVLREQLRKIFCKYETYLVPIGKFLMALLTFCLINITLGYMTKLDKFPVALILALLCSFLPVNIMIVLAAGMILAHMYALSMECAIVVGVVFLLMFLLYFRFSPKDTFIVLLTPICFALKIPYVIPLAAGLVGAPTSVVSTGCGVVVYYILEYLNGCSSALTALDAEGMIAKFRYIIDGLFADRAMITMVVAFSATILVVYGIRRMNIDHAWTIAIVVGGLLDILILLVGDLMFTTNISILGTILGTAAAFAIVKVIQFFVFNVDYSRTEKVQFEDDEYYYYVKAVPKVTISAPEKKVKKVSGKAEIHESVKAKESRISSRENRVSLRENDVPSRENKSSMRENSVLLREVKAPIRENSAPSKEMEQDTNRKE